MPFDPKLILPDDAPLAADGDLQLPDELVALAEQLGDDARHLAAKYPADWSLAAVRGAADVRRRWVRPALLVASLLIALFTGIAAFQQLQSQRAAQSSPVAAATLPAAEPRIREEVPGASMTFPPNGAEISLTELSSPELEAVFDLWQRGEADEHPGIAF